TQGGTATIQTSIATAGPVKVLIRDQAGKTVRTIVDEKRAVGTYRDSWDGKDSSGNVVTDGAYYASLQYTDAKAVTQTIDLSMATTSQSLTFDSTNAAISTVDGTTCVLDYISTCTVAPFSNNFLKVTFQLDQASVINLAIRLSNSGDEVAPLFR